MFSVDDLQCAVTRLYQSGIGEASGYDAEDVEAMLDQVNFPALLQALCHRMQTVYAYTTQGKLPKSYNYRGPDLFEQDAVRLYENLDQCRTEIATVCHKLELWLLEDMSFEAVACVTLALGDDEYLTEYRTVKGDDPWACGMDLDLNELTDILIEMCGPCFKDEQPIYEL